MKKHPTIPYLYITETGEVFHHLAASPSSNGYHTVKTCAGTVRRHTLVAETYLGLKPADKDCVRHIDGDPSNDHYTNLAWATQAENCADTVMHGRSRRGETNPQAKLTEAQAREVLARRRAGESGSVLAKEFGISQAAVCDLHAGRTWRFIQ